MQSAGNALALVDAVVEASQHRMDQEVPAGYSIARPPGHHATANQSMGFCLLNNVAIAARYAQQHHGLKKVPMLRLTIPNKQHLGAFADHDCCYTLMRMPAFAVSFLLLLHTPAWYQDAGLYY